MISAFPRTDSFIALPHCTEATVSLTDLASAETAGVTSPSINA
jgi:hypothetical protein